MTEKLRAVQKELRQLQDMASEADADMLAYLIQVATVECEDVLAGKRLMSSGHLSPKSERPK